jgi:hypothetical protein
MYNMNMTKAIKQNYFQRLHCRHLARGLQTIKSAQVTVRIPVKEEMDKLTVKNAAGLCSSAQKRRGVSSVIA